MEHFIPPNATIKECMDEQSANNTYKKWGNVTYGAEKTRWTSGVNFINILRAAFAPVDPISIKRY